VRGRNKAIGQLFEPSDITPVIKRSDRASAAIY